MGVIEKLVLTENDLRAKFCTCVPGCIILLIKRKNYSFLPAVLRGRDARFTVIFSAWGNAPYAKFTPVVIVCPRWLRERVDKFHPYKCIDNIPRIGNVSLSYRT